MSDETRASAAPEEETRLHGVVAEFSSVDGIMKAAEKARDRGFTKWDVHTPFPVHGLDDAMGIRPTMLPFIVLGAGLTGLFGAILMQWWMNAVDYPFLISGKPLFSLPANVPIIFESTVLLAGVTAFKCVLVMNGLPKLYSPLSRLKRFTRATDDRFFLVVEASDPLFEEKATSGFLQEIGAEAVESCIEPAKESPIPRGLVLTGVVAVLFSFVPLAWAYKARGATSTEPRVHIIQDMDFQPKLKAQSHSPLFEDGRAMRKPVEGTVSYGARMLSSAFGTGKDADGAWVKDLPSDVPLTAAFMERGHERYDIFCSACHGYDGLGQGIVNQRAVTLREGGKAVWVDAASLHQARLRDNEGETPVGRLFDVITNGINEGTMMPYGDQIPPEDRWAIVMYLRAMQASQTATAEEVKDLK